MKLFLKAGKFIKKILVYFYVLFRNFYFLRTFQIYRKSDEIEKFTQILEGINYIKVAGNNGNIIPAVYYEFGCFSGRTFAAAINSAKFLNIDFKYYAFDSFLGLPSTDEKNIFKKGQFKFSKQDFKKIIKMKTGKTLKDENIIEGFYEQALETRKAQELPKAGIIYLDCDLYSSTISALNFLKKKIVSGSVLLFDDYYCYPVDQNLGQKKAIDEFLKENTNFELRKWKAFSSFGQSFFFINKSDKN
ncbi:TylF/MycF family methyltransferase [Candidatus Pelagibacter sp.]|nr:TylF/MycF family methyltransferase [Candidatus Pelagibacter sp.]